MEHGHESPLQVDVSWDGVVATVTASGELDTATAAVLARHLLAVAAEHPERLVLDLGELVFIDVAATRVLDDVHTLLQTECPVILRQPRTAAKHLSPPRNRAVRTATRVAYDRRPAALADREH